MNKERKIWDLERLVSSADAFAVARAIGIRMRKNGSTTYIECVDGTHKETNLNHCQLFRDGCHCYSCGSNHNIYGMVRGYYENVLGTRLEHDEICSIIADTCGGEEQYLLNPVKSGPKKKPFPLTNEELAAIGLATDTQRAKQIVSFSERKTEECSETCRDGYIKTELLPSVSIFSLYREDEEMFRTLVKGKIGEAIEETRELYGLFKDGQDEFSQAVVRIASERYRLARSAAEKVFPKFQKKVS